jgi:hypothetical protein
VATPYGLVVAAIAALAFAGCDSLECGEGTAESGGACVPADGVSPDDPQCGAGTVFDPVAQACVPERPPTECGPNTEPVEGPDGVIECVGTGTSCADPLPCPLPDGGDVSVCGRLIDAETSAPIAAGDGTDTSVCDPASPTADGPCALQLVFVDAIAFATDPGSAAPLLADEITLDSCGRFRALDVAEPPSGFLGVAIDDSMAGATDAHVTTGIGLPVAPNARLDGVTLVATRRSTDQAWTTSAGDPFAGQTFSEIGAILVTYVHAGLPVAGVEITAGGAPVSEADDFYFDDANPAVKSSVAAGQNATGINGAALAVGTSLGEHSGSGGEPDGCTWSTAPGASIPGVIFATRRDALMGTDPCP